MLEREENWVAVDSFCTSVMVRKESAEREREGERDAEMGGGGRARRRGRAPPRRPGDD